MNEMEMLHKLHDDSKFYIESLLWIKTKKRQLIRFKLNKGQKKIHDVIQKLRDEHKPVRIIILKARQIGASTLIEGEIFHDTANNENVTSLIIAHDKESTQHLFKMSKLFYDKLDGDFKPMRRTSNKIEVLFENPSQNEKTREREPGLRSIIRVDTANNMQAGTSFTIHNLHISELAKWERPEEVMPGLMQSVPDIPDTMVVIESTAYGDGGYFCDMWKDAKAGKNDFVPIFIGWQEEEEYRKEVPPDFEIIDWDHPNYGNELKIKQRYNLDDEQIYWRRWTIKNKCNNRLDKFTQENPSNDIEAFISTGKNVFDTDAIEDYRAQIKNQETQELINPPQIGEFVEDENGKIEFKLNHSGAWALWKKPEVDNRYILAADVAEGLADGNYSTIEVIDKKDMEQAAEYRGHIRPETFAKELAKVGKYYNEGLIAVEVNNHGLTTLTHLKPIYYRLYYRPVFGKRVSHVSENLGWKTTGKTKPLMIDNLDKALRDKDLILYSERLLDELATYTEFADGSMGASGSNFDDLVMALAIAVMVWPTLPLNIKGYVKPENKHRNPYTGY
jgi:hypothetical protein